MKKRNLMCVGIAQYHLYLDQTKKTLDDKGEGIINYPLEAINQLNPKSYWINLGRSSNSAVIITQASPNKAHLAEFGGGFLTTWGKPLYNYNIRVEGSEKKGFNSNNDPNYSGEYHIKNNHLDKKYLRKQRCIVPVDFFLENPKKEKTKFIIRKEDEQAFHLAGIYTELVDTETGEITPQEFALLTTPPSKITQAVSHPRSPLILQDEHLEFYLNPETKVEQLEALYLPPESNGFIAYEVDQQIAKHSLPEGFMQDDPRLIMPIGETIKV